MTFMYKVGGNNSPCLMGLCSDPGYLVWQHPKVAKDQTRATRHEATDGGFIGAINVG